jgi:hypothetical protein
MYTRLQGGVLLLLLVATVLTACGAAKDSVSPIGGNKAAAIAPAATTTPRASAGDTLPTAYVGTWSGSITDKSSAKSPYPVTSRFVEGGIGDVVARVEYPTLGCTANWTFTRISVAVVVVQETTTSGGCYDVGVTLTLKQDGTIRYCYQSCSGDAILRRTG